MGQGGWVCHVGRLEEHPLTHHPTHNSHTGTWWLGGRNGIDYVMEVVSISSIPPMPTHPRQQKIEYLNLELLE